MQRLTGLDASFLYLETPSQPLHVCSIMELDTSTIPGGYAFDRLREDLSARIAAMPEFRDKLADNILNLDRPVWVEDKDFDVDKHVHRIGVPAPGGRAELSEICGHIAAVPLDRSRPLWEMWVIEGVDGTDVYAGGRLAVMTKVHHAAVDGVTGANLLSHLCTTEADAPVPEPVAGSGQANHWEIAGRGLLRFAARPLLLATKVLPETVSTVVDTARRALAGSAMASPFTAPQTPFNASISGRRSVAYAQLELDDVKAVKHHYGVKVNDVVLALVAGALRKYLADLDELPETPLIATVPVSVHERSDRPGRNKVSCMFTSLQTDVEDPSERLIAIAQSTSVAKEHSSAIAASLLQDWSQFAATSVFGVAMRLYASTRLTEARPIQNLVVSNVPGPQVPLYFLGAQVRALYPFGPLLHGSGLNVTVMSLNGRIDVGLISTPELMPDLWDLADNFVEAMKELLATVG
jgi:diacylglycerol O-acyltransferase / wax synthase